MSSYWKTAKDILKGKAKGSKLILLGVFMVGIGVTLQIALDNFTASVFWILGIVAFMRGIGLYEDETRAELEKKREKNRKA